VPVRTYVRSSVTLGVASSVANDVIMRTGAASAVGARRHNENDVIMIINALWRYGDWRHVATGFNALVTLRTCRTCSVASSRRRHGAAEAVQFLGEFVQFAGETVQPRR